MRVKVLKYKRGYLLSIGVDDEDYDVPTKIFYNNKVIDPMVYAVTGTELDDATNRMYVKENELEKILNDVKNFYREYAKYNALNIELHIIEGVFSSQAGVIETNEQIILQNKPPVRKITIEERVRELLKENGIELSITTNAPKTEESTPREKTPHTKRETRTMSLAEESVVYAVKIDATPKIPEV